MAHSPVEERANRPVNNSTGENRFIARPAFPLKKARAENSAGGVELLFVVNNEREEINSLPFSFTHHRRGEDDRITILNEHRTIRLICEVGESGGQSPTTDFQRIFLLLHKTTYQ